MNICDTGINFFPASRAKTKNSANEPTLLELIKTNLNEFPLGVFLEDLPFLS